MIFYYLEIIKKMMMMMMISAEKMPIYVFAHMQNFPKRSKFIFTKKLQEACKADNEWQIKNQYEWH